MADKKTSQETSGAPIQINDLWRIARSGSNYKLTSEELFSETISLSDFLNKASVGDLIGGRNYLVTGCGVSGLYDVIITATDPTSFSKHGIIYDPGNVPVDGALIMLDNTLTGNNAILDVRGNFWMQTWISGMSGNSNQFISHQDQPNGSNKYYNNSVFENSLVYSTGDININNSVLQNVTIISDSATNTIQNCNLSNCTISLNDGITLSGITIIGDDPVRLYDFFESASNGTIVSGQFSTLTKTLNLSSAGTYNGTDRIALSPYNAWVGTYLLTNAPSPSMDIQYIAGCENTHTPVIFKHSDSSNPVMQIQHTNSIAVTSPEEICFASHHASNDHLDSPESYVKMRWDSGLMIWRAEEIVNYPA